jgi:hypothetical protein
LRGAPFNVGVPDPEIFDMPMEFGLELMTIIRAHLTNAEWKLFDEILYADRGSQNCSHDYPKVLRQNGSKGSMSSKGNRRTPPSRRSSKPSKLNWSGGIKVGQVECLRLPVRLEQTSYEKVKKYTSRKQSSQTDSLCEGGPTRGFAAQKAGQFPTLKPGHSFS